MNDVPVTPLVRSDEEWKKELPAATFSVMRKASVSLNSSGPWMVIENVIGKRRLTSSITVEAK